MDTLSKGVPKILLMHDSFIRHGTDISILNLDVESLLLRQIVELVVDEVSVVHILLKTDDGEAFKCLRLVHHLVETV